MRRCYTLSCAVAAIGLLAFRPAGAQGKIRVGLSSIRATWGSIWVAKGADPKQFVDESLVREVEASGFIERLYEPEYR